MILKSAKQRRKNKVRSRISGTADIPRISVFRSNKSIYAQAIDDVSSNTIASFTSLKVKGNKDIVTKVNFAFETGKELGNKLLELKIKKAVFDRSHYRYHGRVSNLADGIRGSGIVI